MRCAGARGKTSGKFPESRCPPTENSPKAGARPANNQLIATMLRMDEPWPADVIIARVIVGSQAEVDEAIGFISALKEALRH